MPPLATRPQDSNSNNTPPPAEKASLPTNSPDHTDVIPPLTVEEMIETYPERRPFVIDGIVRLGETVNIIGPSKIGKSWIMYGIAFAVATGTRWLDTYDTNRGRVLLLDNELYPEELAHRLKVVSKSLNIDPGKDLGDYFKVVSLRGQQADYNSVSTILAASLSSKEYSLIIADSHYRMIPPNVSENDNSQIKLVYNCIDALARLSEAAWMLVHHPSKGSQDDKAVTDVGSGAGSQSRACDAHIVLRKHKSNAKDNLTYVMDGVFRSFEPMKPLVVQWQYPHLKPRHDLNPEDIKVKLMDKRVAKGDGDKIHLLKVVREANSAVNCTLTQLAARLRMDKTRCKRLIEEMEAAGSIFAEDVNASGNITKGYTAG